MPAGTIPPSGTSTKKSTDTGRGRILVVDDDESLRELLALHLTQAGYQVAVAEDAISAGHYILEFGVPKLMVVDINMPYMDGLEFVEAVQADRSIEPFPVIFLTVDPSTEKRARALGGAGFLTKPVLVDRLLQEIERHIARRAMAPISAAFGPVRDV